MKLRNIILYLGLASVLSSCEDGYLETSPESSTGKSTIFESTDNAKLVINGIMRSMYRQYLSTQGINGEPVTKYWFSDFQSDDLQVVAQTSWASLYNSNDIDNETSMYNYYMWYYYYKLIGNANSVIANIDAATVSENEGERLFIKAQALTMRAFSYSRLAEFYCPRWSERNTYPQGLVLRLDESTGALAPSSQEDVYAQIYQDLDDAIKLYADSGTDADAQYGSGSAVYLPTPELAYGVYARTALYREDWATAAKYAALARANCTLMSVDEYVDGGFNTPNSEWIFCSDGAATQTLHYYGFFSYMGSNSSSSASRSYPKAMSKTLYDKIPATDIRRDMFLDPALVPGITDYSARYASTAKDNVKKTVDQLYPGKLYSTSYAAAYMQFKFQGLNGAYNVGDPCHMRASEMYLIEAEALARQGQDEAARKLLTELVKDSGRDPEFSTSLSGNDLIEQVKLYRRIELWGEGFRWYDLKRYGEPRIRLTMKDGGSFAVAFCVNLQPEDKNHWTYVYPQRETDYNDAFKENTVPVKTEQ